MKKKSGKLIKTMHKLTIQFEWPVIFPLLKKMRSGLNKKSHMAEYKRQDKLLPVSALMKKISSEARHIGIWRFGCGSWDSTFISFIFIRGRYDVCTMSNHVSYLIFLRCQTIFHIWFFYDFNPYFIFDFTRLCQKRKMRLVRWNNSCLLSVL